MIKSTHSLPHESLDEFSRKTQKRSLNIGSILLVAGDKLWVKVSKGTTVSGATSNVATNGDTSSQNTTNTTIGADGKVVNQPQTGVATVVNLLESAGKATSTTPSAQNSTFINPFQALLDAQQGKTTTPPTTTKTAPTVQTPPPTVTPPSVGSFTQYSGDGG